MLDGSGSACGFASLLALPLYLRLRRLVLASLLLGLSLPLPPSELAAASGRSWRQRQLRPLPLAGRVALRGTEPVRCHGVQAGGLREAISLTFGTSLVMQYKCC